MQALRKIVLRAGIAGGLLFTIHACIPYCGGWPIIWPALAGAMAVWLATREPQPHRWRTGLLAALGTGVVTGAIAFVGIATVVYFVARTGIAPAFRQNGASSATLASVTAAGSVAIAAPLAAIDAVVAFLGGVLTLPARYFQARQAQG